MAKAASDAKSTISRTLLKQYSWLVDAARRIEMKRA
jgi:hypothetical protein